MNEHIKHQVIEKNGVPLFVIVPYSEYLEVFQPKADMYLPNEVVKAHALEGKSLIRAWREYKGLSQKEVADKMGVSQSAYSQTERSDNPHESTLRNVAAALEIDADLLTISD